MFKFFFIIIIIWISFLICIIYNCNFKNSLFFCLLYDTVKRNTALASKVVLAICLAVFPMHNIQSKAIQNSLWEKAVHFPPKLDGARCAWNTFISFLIYCH